MAPPQPPIIVLRKGDDAVSAFFSKDEALQHLVGVLGDQHGVGDNASQADFFDARGRRLTPMLNSDGQLEDLPVESEESHVDHVRERVRRRSVHAREMLERRPNAEHADTAPLTLADEDIDFEVFAWRLANVLRPEYKPWNVQDDSGGWWHNTFSH